MARTLIALGSNLGDRQAGLDEAILILAQSPGVRLVAKAIPLETVPIGVPDSDALFVNSAATFDVELGAREWLELLLATERQLGRQRSVRWGARKIDLDLLLFDREIHDERPLRVPHPRMGFRRFVMKPAVQIAAEMWHPTCECTLGELDRHLDSAANWIWWPHASNAPVNRLFDSPDRRRLTAQASAEEWQEAMHWLSAAPLFGDRARVVVTERWPAADDPLRVTLATLPVTPKLVIQSFQGPDPYREILAPGQSAVRLRLPLESHDMVDVLRDVDAAIEALIST